MAGRSVTGYNAPLEDDECKVFHQWLDIVGVPHTHIPNESRSSKKDAVIRGKKLALMGVSRGYWDYDVYIPVRDVSGKVASFELVKVEMKRVRKNLSKTSDEQKEWGKIYEKAGIKCKICYGAEDAINWISSVYEDINLRKITKKAIEF